MAENDDPGEPTAGTERANGKAGNVRAAPRAQSTPAAGQSASRPKRAPREPAVNAIEASRRPRRGRLAPDEATPAAEGVAAPSAGNAPATLASSPASTGNIPRADSDPWTVPKSVRDRFVQDGHRFYFPDGAAAFKDLGRKLTTPSENTQVVNSLIEIAHSRGWTEVSVSGTDRFRHEAWRQARLAGLNVRGYRPTEIEYAQLVRALGRNLPRSSNRADSISADPQGGAPRPAQAASEVFPGSRQETGGSAKAEARSAPQERLVGQLLDHGRDAYRHDPNQEPSYFVRLKTPDGNREVWGKDIERAVAKSLTQPQIGDQVVLQRTGRDAVTVQRQERDPEGQVRRKEVEVYRNRWVIEKQEFFEQRAAAAQMVRNEAIGLRDAVRQHPELAGTYLNLRAAELAARALRDPQDQRRFVAQVRGALADGVERGEPLQPVRLRTRTVAFDREQAQVRS